MSKSKKRKTNKEGAYILNEVAFSNHMETKAKSLNAIQVVIGTDFAVFSFQYGYQADAAFQKFTANNAFYDYSIKRSRSIAKSINSVMIFNKNFHSEGK